MLARRYKAQGQNQSMFPGAHTTLSAAEQAAVEAEQRLHWASLQAQGMRDYLRVQLPDTLGAFLAQRLRSGVLRRIRKVLRESRGEPFVDTLLDVGCGPGDWTVAYAAIARGVLGQDINPGFVEAGRQRAAREGVADCVRFEVGDLTDFTLPEGFDMVSFGACLQVVNDQTVLEIFRRLQEDGPENLVVYVRSTVRNPLVEGNYSRIGFYRTRQSYEEVFRRFGFTVRDCAYSQEIVLQELIDRPLRSELAAPVWRALRLVQVARRRSEFCNWVLTR